MRCQKCGAYIRDDSIYCNYCGEKVIVHVPKKEAEEPEQEAVRPRDEDFDVSPTTPKEEEEERTVPRMQRLWVIALIILSGVLFAVGAVFVYRIQKKNQRTVINPQVSSQETTPETSSETLPPSSEATAASGETPETSENDSIEAVISESPENSESETAPSETETETPEETPEESAQEEDLEGGSSASESAQSDTAEESAEGSSLPEGVEVEYGGMIYMITDGRATLEKCYSADAVIELPSEIEGAKLTAIGEAAFANCEHMTAIDIPEGVESFGEYAFTYCRNLKIIVIPDSMTNLGAHCFDHCGWMTFVVHEGSFGYLTAVRNNVLYVIGDSVQDAENTPPNYPGSSAAETTAN